AVGAHRLPVAAAGENPAAEPLALELAAEDLTHPSVHPRRPADDEGLRYVDHEGEQGTDAHLRHLARQNGRKGRFVHNLAPVAGEISEFVRMRLGSVEASGRAVERRRPPERS